MLGDSELQAPGAGTQVSDQSPLVQTILIFRRRWRLFGVVLAATLLLAAVYTFTTTKLYRPQATLEIRPEMTQVESSKDEAAQLTSFYLWDNYYRTQEAILTSPSLAKLVLKDLPDVEREYVGFPDAAKVLAGSVDVEKVRSSFIMKVGYVDQDKDKATRIVNAFVNRYIDDANRRLRELKTGTVDLLAKETLPSIRQRVEDADKTVQAFKTETGFIDFNEQYGSLVEERRKISSRLTDLRLKRANLQAETQALGGYGSNGVSGVFNPAFHATKVLEYLVQQRAKLQEDLAREAKSSKGLHPKVAELKAQIDLTEERIREAIGGTLKALETDLDKVEREEKALVEQQKAVETRMGEVGRQLTRFTRLESEMSAAREVYNSYLRRYGETTATSGSGLASVRVIDFAFPPPNPFKPRIMMNLALAAILGVFLGLGAVFLTEQLDDRIASPREVEAFIGLQVLSVVPKLKEGLSAGSKPILLGEGSSLAEFEAFRALRTEIATRLEGIQGTKTIAIISSLESEGKSTVAVNLARAIAMEGRRVLLLDADLRRPSICPLIGKEKGKGLDELLLGSATIQECIQPSAISGVDVLGAQKGTSKAAELASSLRFDEVLKEAKARYDVIIVDSAPVNQVAESVLVARRADATVLVIRDKKTGRGTVQQARKRLEGAKANVIGAVLNCATRRGAGYGYYDYYYYSYYSHYGKDEAESPKA